VFLRAQAAERAGGLNTSTKTKVFFNETKGMLKAHWTRCIYGVLLMTGAFLVPDLVLSLLPLTYDARSGFSFLSHGSQVCMLEMYH
jgi:SHS family lactate transporter-like MFS transporter